MNVKHDIKNYTKLKIFLIECAYTFCAARLNFANVAAIQRELDFAIHRFQCLHAYKFNLSRLTLQSFKPTRHKTNRRYNVQGCFKRHF